ncbi:MAG: hypothetical protein II956_13915 [Bacteroidales bacterium]|nr:hypothetical protein [Bacteroidales bacterium]
MFQTLSKGVEKEVFTPETFAFEGKIIITDKGFGFVKFDGKSIYVPVEMLSGKQFKNKTLVKGRYKKSFNKKKNEDGFTAVEIN